MYKQLVIDGAERRMRGCRKMAFEQKLERDEIVIMGIVSGGFGDYLGLREDVVMF